jgi:SAM-dependent methyltransferase
MQPQAFDSYASEYDNHFTQSLIGRAQREQVYKYLGKHLSSGIKNVLEINCGTGEDAIWLWGKGKKVLATDISAGMLNAARKKSSHTDIEFQELKSQKIVELRPAEYDLIFSNFGGLNCLSPEELKEFKDGCDLLQHRSGKIALVIMGSNCWWEKFYFTVKGNRSLATRRESTDGADTVIDGVHFKTFYYSPAAIKTLFSNSYQTVLLKPIGLFVPPSYLGAYFNHHKTFFKLTVWLDKFLARFSFTANQADHFIIILEKK